MLLMHYFCYRKTHVPLCYEFKEVKLRLGLSPPGFASESADAG